MDDREFLAVRRLAAKCVSTATPGRSLEALALLSANILGSLSVGQFRRWHLDYWKVACGLGQLAFPLNRLHDDFDQVEEPSKCAEARGPIAGAMLELRKIGWGFAGQFKWHSD